MQKKLELEKVKKKIKHVEMFDEFSETWFANKSLFVKSAPAFWPRPDLLTFSPADYVEDCFNDGCIGGTITKQTCYHLDQIQHSQFMTLTLDVFLSWSLTAVSQLRLRGAVKTGPVCSELLCVLLCIHYAFIKRTNWPYELSLYA